MHNNDHTPHPHESHYGSLTSYILGFTISAVFTLAAYAMVEYHVISEHAAFSHAFLVALVLVFAIAQMCVQLIAFLHLGRESTPRWNLIVFAYAAVLLLALVLGSIWIINNLNYNMMMTPQEMDAYMLDQ
jgi:cytochrome o ubiquinol oxidase operon protein cyoD